MTVKLEEKLALMAEIGMTSAVRQFETEAQMLSEVARLSAMKFHRITKKEIDAKLENDYCKSWDEVGGDGVGIPFVGFLGGCFLGLICSCPWVPKANVVISIVFSFAAMGIGVGVSAAWWGRTMVDRMPLNRWTDNIPYGACLAVKEAKAIGLTDFEIFYPVTEQAARLKADPVIVGRDKFRNMYEVFAWDDGKIYE